MRLVRPRLPRVAVAAVATVGVLAAGLAGDVRASFPPPAALRCLFAPPQFSYGSPPAGAWPTCAERLAADDSPPARAAGPTQDSNTDADPATPGFFERMARDQEAADRAWRTAARGAMRLDKVTYTSLGLQVPAFVFRPLGSAAPRSRPVMVWVHENIRGRFYPHYIPYVREAVARGYVVIAPEYRGSIGYGRSFFDAIDYGGAEVDDVVRALATLPRRFPEIDPERAGIVGWSHGGLIALLAVTRHPEMFDAVAAIVPVSNLIRRLAIKGDRLRATIDPHNRLGGPPTERPTVYRDRSPYFQIDRLSIPVLVHVASNDEDVTPEESRPFIEQLQAQKGALADIKVYERPFGGHLFDRQVDPNSWQPLDTPDQVDSWSRLWRFFERHIGSDAASTESVRTAAPR